MQFCNTVLAPLLRWYIDCHPQKIHWENQIKRTEMRSRSFYEYLQKRHIPIDVESRCVGCIRAPQLINFQIVVCCTKNRTIVGLARSTFGRVVGKILVNCIWQDNRTVIIVVKDSASKLVGMLRRAPFRRSYWAEKTIWVTWNYDLPDVVES